MTAISDYVTVPAIGQTKPGRTTFGRERTNRRHRVRDALAQVGADGWYDARVRTVSPVVVSRKTTEW